MVHEFALNSIQCKLFIIRLTSNWVNLLLRKRKMLFKGKVRSFFSMRFEIKIINLWHKASSSGFHCTVAVNCCYQSNDFFLFPNNELTLSHSLLAQLRSHSTWLPRNQCVSNHFTMLMLMQQKRSIKVPEERNLLISWTINLICASVFTYDFD